MMLNTAPHDNLTGVQRAAKRLAAKREANKLIPFVENYTRQQAHVETRNLVKADRAAEAKAGLAARKVETRKRQAKWAEEAKANPAKVFPDVGSPGRILFRGHRP